MQTIIKYTIITLAALLVSLTDAFIELDFVGLMTYITLISYFYDKEVK